MPHEAISEAIVTEALSDMDKPFGTWQKLKGWTHNKFWGGVREAFGGSPGVAAKAGQAGRGAVTLAPQLVSQVLKLVPVVGPVVSAISAPVTTKAAAKLKKKLDELHRENLKSQSSRTVEQMTDLLQRGGGEAAITAETLQQLHDAVRKLEQAYKALAAVLPKTNNCESVFEAAKAWAYLKYRVGRMHWYVSLFRAHMDEIEEATEAYSAHVIAYEEDLKKQLDDFFLGAGWDAAYHTKYCKKSSCYFEM